MEINYVETDLYLPAGRQGPVNLFYKKINTPEGVFLHYFFRFCYE